MNEVIQIRNLDFGLIKMKIVQGNDFAGLSFYHLLICFICSARSGSL